MYEVHKLKIEVNNQSHQGHLSNEELKPKYELRSQGCSDFGKLIIKRLNLHLKKQVERISTLQNLLQADYKIHIPNSQSLSNYCYQLKQELFFKEFDGTLGTFESLSSNYSFEKASSEVDLIILDINKDIENFVLVFTCKHFLTHFKKQNEINQPSFFVSDTTFSLLRNNYKLLIIGNLFY